MGSTCVRRRSRRNSPPASRRIDPASRTRAPTGSRPLLRGRVPVTWRCRSAVRAGCRVPSVNRTCFRGRVRADRRRWERSKGCVLQRGWPEEREAGERDHAADPRQRAKRNRARAAWALRPQGAPHIPASLAHALVAPRIDRLGPLNLCASYGTDDVGSTQHVHRHTRRRRLRTRRAGAVARRSKQAWESGRVDPHGAPVQHQGTSQCAGLAARVEPHPDLPIPRASPPSHPQQPKQPAVQGCRCCCCCAPKLSS